MALYFITGNQNKFRELQALLPSLVQLDLDLPEIQEINAKTIIHEKLKEALKHQNGEFIVEDTSLYLDCLHGLPGPLIKWFLKTMGNAGLATLAKQLGNTAAEAKTLIGYAKGPNDIHFFEGALRGEVLAPQGATNFGWDPIFQPLGHDRTLAQMTLEEKNMISMRSQAFKQLIDFLNNET